MVKAHYKNDLTEYKRFGIFHTLHARWWYIAMFSTLFLLIGAGLLVSGILSADAGILSCAAVSLAFAIAYPFLNVFFQISRIKKSVATNRNYNLTEQYFTFTQDGISLRIRMNEHTADYEIPYKQILKIFETKQNFYIYIGKQQALKKKKNDIDEGTIDELSGLFRKGAGKRFREKKNLRRI